MSRFHREFIIDGYNLLHACGLQASTLTLEEQRTRLEANLIRAQERRHCKITVVYDGRSHGRALKEAGALNKVFTASKVTADEWIIDFLRSSPKRARQLTVVSSDRLIVSHASAYGAACMSSETFASSYLEESPTKCNNTTRSEHAGKHADKPLSDREVNAWMKLFDKENGRKGSS